MEQSKRENRIDLIFAVALIAGALVLAVISWMLPTHSQAPMTAEMKGTVEEIYESYEGTRVSIKLEDNSVKFTLLKGTYEALETEPRVGDDVRIIYELTSYREIRDLRIEQDNGAEAVAYHEPNPALQALNRSQLTAFAVFGLYAVVCFLVHRRMIRKIKQ